VSLRDIRKYQKGCELLCQKAPFAASVRERAKDYTEHIRFGPNALINMQYLVESLTIDILEAAVEVCIYAGRETVKGDDIRIVCRLKGVDMYHTVSMTNPGMERMGRRAGVKFFDHSSEHNYYEITKMVMGHYINMLVKTCVHLIQNYKMKTVNMKVFSDACGLNGYIIPTDLHFNTVKRKASRKGATSSSAAAEESDEESEIEEESIDEEVEVGDAETDEE
jgi:histone H3/H4